MINSFCEKIELTITSSIECIDDLFDYNSDQARQAELYFGQRVLLPVPDRRPYYYFFHKHKHNLKTNIEIERRRQPVSDLTQQSQHQLLTNYKLLGGIELARDSQRRVVMKLLKASDIRQAIKANVQLMTEQEESPYKPKLIVRSFQNGYPLCTGQELRLGKVELVVTDIDHDPENNEHYRRDGDVMKLRQRRGRTLFEWKLSEEETSNREEESEEQSSSPAMCRVCNDVQTAEDILVSPCKCIGTIKYIHISCLKRWIEMKNRKVRDNLVNFENGSHKGLECEICKQKMPKVVLFPDGERVSLLNLKGETLISLQHKHNLLMTHLINRYMIPLSKQKPITIGRYDYHSIPLGEPSVSRKHCTIELSHNGQIVMKDNTSKFGTLVYDNSAEICLKRKIRGFQIENVAFGVKIVEDKES